jgi:hypothetical protein
MPWKECSVMDEPGDYVLNNLCFNFQIGTNGLPSKFNTAILTRAKVVFITAYRTTSVFTDRWNMELAHGMCSPEPVCFLPVREISTAQLSGEMLPRPAATASSISIECDKTSPAYASIRDFIPWMI